jgi:hypothetical protein
LAGAAAKAYVSPMCATDPTSPLCKMKFSSPEISDAINEFAYDAEANYAYEKMRVSTTPAEKLTWKTKMITNKCARATLINARH